MEANYIYCPSNHIYKGTQREFFLDSFGNTVMRLDVRLNICFNVWKHSTRETTLELMFTYIHYKYMNTNTQEVC
jgi:hypothetical protein